MNDKMYFSINIKFIYILTSTEANMNKSDIDIHNNSRSHEKERKENESRAWRWWCSIYFFLFIVVSLEYKRHCRRGYITIYNFCFLSRNNIRHRLFFNLTKTNMVIKIHVVYCGAWGYGGKFRKFSDELKKSCSDKELDIVSFYLFF